MDRRLVDHFVNAKLISRAGMQRIILKATKNKSGVVAEMLASEALDEPTIIEGIVGCYGYETLDTQVFDAAPMAFKMISGTVAQKHGVMPFAISDSGDEISIAVFDVEQADEVIDTLKTATGNNPHIFVAPSGFVESAIAHFYFDKPWKDKPPSAVPAPPVVDMDDEADLSDEILLEEIIEVPEPTPEPKLKLPKPTPKRSAPRAKPATRKKAPVDPTPPPKEPERDSVEQALDDFDDFLESSYTSGAPGVNDDLLPGGGWDSGAAMTAGEGFEGAGGFDASGFGDFDDDSFDEGAFSDDSRGGFDLFEASEAVASSVEELVAQHEDTIARLSREIKGQREVVSSLVDLLVEHRIISRKELMTLVKTKRNN